MCAKRGRPRIYDSIAAKKKSARERLKEAGCKEIRLSVPEEYKKLFDIFSARNNMSQTNAFCYLLDLHFDFSDPNEQTQNY